MIAVNSATAASASSTSAVVAEQRRRVDLITKQSVRLDAEELRRRHQLADREPSLARLDAAERRGVEPEGGGEPPLRDAAFGAQLGDPPADLLLREVAHVL